MQRLIVTSATYRQSSQVTPELLEKDPENRLLARGPRFRLPAEMVRDKALAVERSAERADRRPQRVSLSAGGLWEELAFGDGFSAQAYEQSTATDLYRRSMYTFWKRTGAAAAMITFDAPDARSAPRGGPYQHAAAGAGAAERSDLSSKRRACLAQRMMPKAAATPADAHRFGFRAGDRARPPSRESRSPARSCSAANCDALQATTEDGAQTLLNDRRIAASTRN